MKLSNLKPAEGSTKTGKRVGRGQGSGHGGTATRGHKGQKSRSGYSKKIGFEGGQMPLQRRVPKYGFKNINRVEYRGINLDMVQALVDRKKVKEITPAILVEGGLAHKNDLVKILGRGELTTKLKITAHAFSKSAKAGIEAAGGEVVTLETKKEAPKKEKAPKAKKEEAPVKKVKEEVVEAVAEEANEENEA